jgi:hypothetical protein
MSIGSLDIATTAHLKTAADRLLRGNSGQSRPGSCGPAKWQGREDPSEFDLL